MIRENMQLLLIQNIHISSTKQTLTVPWFTLQWIYGFTLQTICSLLLLTS